MQNSEIKRRIKCSDQKQNGEKRNSAAADKSETDESRDAVVSAQRRSDVKLVLAVMSLSVSVIVMWTLHRQLAHFAEMKEQHDQLYERTRGVVELRSQMSTVSDRCERVHALMASLERPPPVSQLESLEVEVAQLKERFSSLTVQQQELQKNVTSLVQAVQNMEKQTVVMSNDVTSKVASIRTDVRRMGGLEGEVEALLSQTNTLQQKVSQTEKLMVKRIGDLLASSIDRVSGLKSSTERNTQRLDQISKQLQGVSTANSVLSDRILKLESSQAKMLKMTTFAADLKPKVFTIKQDFAIIETNLAELTLRIGQLAEDVMKGEEEITRIKNGFPNRASVQVREDFTDIKYDTLKQKDQLTP